MGWLSDAQRHRVQPTTASSTTSRCNFRKLATIQKIKNCATILPLLWHRLQIIQWSKLQTKCVPFVLHSLKDMIQSLIMSQHPSCHKIRWVCRYIIRRQQRPYWQEASEVLDLMKDDHCPSFVMASTKQRNRQFRFRTHPQLRKRSTLSIAVWLWHLLQRAIRVLDSKPSDQMTKIKQPRSYIKT